jgi:hypothetical protein
MLRKMSFLAVLACVLILSTPGYSQDQPSLGDVARQARKDKEKKAAQPKTVITDDDLPSSKALGGLSDLGSSRSAGDGSAMSRALVRIRPGRECIKQDGSHGSHNACESRLAR